MHKMLRSVLVFTCLSTVANCPAQAGLLDESFGGDGWYTLTGMPGGVHAYALGHGPDGSVYGYGTVLWGFGPGGVGCVFRVLPNGSPDPSFGDQGVVILPFMGANGLAYAPAMDVDAVGRIYVAGSHEVPGEMDLFIHRLLPNGDFDASFGNGGTVVFGTGNGYYDVVCDLSVQPDGKVLVAGTKRNNLISTITIGRWDESGELDPTFGGSGILLLTSVGQSSWCSLVLQEDGRIVLVNNRSSLLEVDGEIIRLQPDGGFDGTFAVNGVFITTGLEQPTDAVVLADGSIVFVTFEEGTIGKIDGSGNWDLTFGNNGVIVPGPTYLTNITSQVDGRLLVCSYSQSMIPEVFRYHPSGALDPSFGDAGSTPIPGLFLEALVQPLLLDDQERLLLAGEQGAQGPAAVVRLTGDNATAVPDISTSSRVGLGYDPGSGKYELLFNDASATVDPWELVDLSGRPLLRLAPVPGQLRRPIALPASLAAGNYLLTSDHCVLRLTIAAPR